MNTRIRFMLTLCVRDHSSACANEKHPLCIPISSQQDIKDEESARCMMETRLQHFPGFTSGLKKGLFDLKIEDTNYMNCDGCIMVSYCQSLIPGGLCLC